MIVSREDVAQIIFTVWCIFFIAVIITALYYCDKSSNLKTQLKEVTEQRDGLMEIYKEKNDCVYKYEGVENE